jgi:sulfatase modifying factor 1
MSNRWLWCLGLAVPLACGKATSSRPNAGDGGPSVGAGTAAGGAGTAAGDAGASASGAGAAASGTNGAGTSGTPAESGGDGGTPSDGGAPAGEGGAEGGAAAEPLPREQASCQAIRVPCGDAQISCCESKEVSGNTFVRYDGNSAVVSDFRLDKFEVTVGRFRAFVDHYPNDLPAPNSGKNPHDGQDTGWDPSWNQQLLSSAAELRKALACSLPVSSWDDAPAENENRPINCVTWFEAEAFCIWDGGRLPSDLEWEYAARGGDRERRAPWSDVPVNSAHGFANCRSNDGAQGIVQIWPVGSSPAGDGLWGQSDLAGNLWEYTVDYFGPALDCTDCARHVPITPATPAGQDLRHVSRGGSYAFDFGDGLWLRDFYYPTGPRDPHLGFRCAYGPKERSPAAQ